MSFQTTLQQSPSIVSRCTVRLGKFAVFVAKEEDETIVHDREKCLCMRRFPERCKKIVRLSSSPKNIRKYLRNGNKELFGINLDESRFLAQNVSSRATCLFMSQSGFLALKLDGCGLRIHQAIKLIRRGE